MPPLHPRCRCAIMYKEAERRGTISGDNFKTLTPERIKAIKNAEDKAYNAETDADFGFKRLANQATWRDEIFRANGDGKGIERMINCQRCVVAHEARMRGYDVIARPSWGADDPLQKVGNWLEVFEENSREIYNCVGKTGAELEKFIAARMTEWGKDSRAFVWFDWKEPVASLGKGHVIVTRLNENDFVQYGDPQKSKISATKYLNEAKPGSVVIMRADTLKFTDKVKRCCMNRGQVI